MKKGSGGGSNSSVTPKKHIDMELDFTLSRAGLGTHRKNCAEKARLDNKIRSLDVMRRRSIQVHEDELREIQQRLAAGAGLGSGSRGSSLSTPRLGDDSGGGGELLVPGGDLPPSSSCRSGRRGSLQPDSSSYSFLTSYASSSSSNCNKMESPSSSNTNVLTLALPPTRRRPSVVLQDLSTPPGQSRYGQGDSDEDGGGDIGSDGNGNHSNTVVTETIIDLLPAGNRPLRARRGSVGVAGAGPGQGEGFDETNQPDDAKGSTGLRAKIAGSLRDSRTDAGASGGGAGPRRGRRADGGAGDIGTIGDGTTRITVESLRTGRGAERRLSVGEESSSGVGARGAEPRGPGPVPCRGRRASLDVGVANSSLLSPPCRSPGGNTSRLAMRRSSCASSQGTDPSTPSTPDSKSRDSSTVFTFPPVAQTTSHNNSSGTSSTTTTSTPNAWCSPRPSYDTRPRLQLQRSQSSEGLISPSTATASRRNHATPAAASPLRHRRNSSLKLPRMQGGARGGARKPVTPCVNRMVLLHSVMQNSSVFQSADLEEGRL